MPTSSPPWTRRQATLLMALACASSACGAGRGQSSGRCANGSESFSPRADVGAALQAHAGAAVEGVVHVVGGIDQLSATGTHRRYEPSQDQWFSDAPLPEPRQGATAAAFNGKLFVFGGSPSSADCAGTTSVFSLDPSLGVWIRRADMPDPRAGAAAVATSSRIFIIGGCGGSANRTVLVYDPVLDAWAIGATMASDREHPAAGLRFDGQILALGGASAGASTETTELYNPVADVWVAGPPMARRRSSHAAASSGDCLFVLGGLDLQAKVALDSAEVLDPDTNEFRTLNSMPGQRHSLVAMPLPDGIFVVGGGSILGIAPTSSTFLLMF